MATIAYNITFNPTPGSFGTLIKYKKNNDPNWTIPNNPANPTMMPSYRLTLDEGSIYYISISSKGLNCLESNVIRKVETPSLTPCCPPDYKLSPDQTFCYKEEVIPATIETQNICVAPSQLSPAYSGIGTRLFRTLSSYDSSLTGTDTWLRTPYWIGNPAGSGGCDQFGRNCVEGNPASPMNREGVWIDADCNGIKDGLRQGAVLQFTHQIITPIPKIVFVGIGGDNTFKLTVNNQVIVDCDGSRIAGGGANSQYNFTCWWIFPIELASGPNYLNFQAVGDGSVVDAAAYAIYDNTDLEIENATKDSDLKYLFRSSQMIGERIDIATCPPGWTLDTSNGTGNYVCRKITNSATVPC